MTIGIALLGTGRIARTAFVPAVDKVDGARLVAVLSRDQARAERFAEETGIPGAYSDLGALLADGAVDAVIVATPDATHEPQVIAAARAGKHVLCEKPMSVSAESCHRMAEAVRAAGVTFAMGYDNRFNAGLARIKAMIEADAIGPVRYVRAYVTTAVSDPTNWRAAGEQSRYWAMSATGTHIVDIYRWYFGDPERAGAAMTAPVHHASKDEIAIVILDYPGRLVAELAAAAVLPYANRIELHGEAGSIVGEEVFGRTHARAFVTHNGTRTAVEQSDPFVAEVADFVEAIREGCAPRATLEDGVRNVEIMDAACGAGLLAPV